MTRCISLETDVKALFVLCLVAANIGEPNAVYLGHGDGTFEPGLTFGDAEESYAIANVARPNAVYWNDRSGRGWMAQSIPEHRVEA